MAIEIAGIKFPRVHRIVTLEQAAFVYHRIPGQEGNATQNLGRDSVRLQIEGIFYGATAGESLDKLRGVFLKREAVDFIADILGTSYTGKVTVDRLEVTQAAQEPDQFSYLLVVAEYVPPPQQEMGTEAIDTQVKLDAQALLDIASLPDALALGSLPELTNPFTLLKNALDPVQEAATGLIDSVSSLKDILGG